ncbi:MmcB family DNA repair protein [Bartonella tamiae]|uniref:DNA repair protein MmcB-related protein n=1 Tax=Bartonella tamiae Th239 TaxID=1094558 RepID=J0ZR85_9HYPH|nr:MmcB family DNA repair protein [Bartonella tamiae]EJF91198.1 hypothetical protein ME5_00530 [Bartonella tamiae Th239]EJF93137.1 hypothetical protein MEG_01351 [Bartonella tamiae Th307]
MPILNLHKNHPLEDGRQSEYALFVRRGVQRFFLQMATPTLSEVPLVDGRRADLIGVDKKGSIFIVEIKSSIADLKADHKWQDYRRNCDKLFFASHDGVPLDLFPEDCGFLLADSFGGHMIREAPEHRLAASTRKALMLRLTRLAARRLTCSELQGFDMSDEKDEML